MVNRRVDSKTQLCSTDAYYLLCGDCSSCVTHALSEKKETLSRLNKSYLCKPLERSEYVVYMWSTFNQRSKSQQLLSNATDYASLTKLPSNWFSGTVDNNLHRPDLTYHDVDCVKVTLIASFAITD